MLLLALDTSAGLGVAVHDGAHVLASRTDPDPRHHAERLAPLVRAVLLAAGHDRRDLTDIAVGVGPAPYTGLRVGVVTALVLAEALGIPVHGICSLDALAATALVTDAGGAGSAAGFVVSSDAKRREVYWGRYLVDRERLRVGDPADGASAAAALSRVEGPDVDPPGDLPSLVPGIPVVSTLADPLALDPGVLAWLAVHRLQHGGELLPPRPLYLRRPDAVEPSPALLRA